MASMFLMPNEAWSALLGAAFGSFITYRFGVVLANKNLEHMKEVSKLDARHTASRDFIKTFARELADIETSSFGHLDLMEYLRQAHDQKHAEAVAGFWHFVPVDKLSSFEDAWSRYRYGENKDGSVAKPDDEGLPHEDLLFLYCSEQGFALEPHIRKRPSQKAIERIRALLDFAT